MQQNHDTNATNISYLLHLKIKMSIAYNQVDVILLMTVNGGRFMM